MEEILKIIVEAAKAMPWYEVVAVFFGLLSVWFAKKENILVFPTGIISVLIYVYICNQAKLYADMGINAYYFVMSIYGWFTWTRQADSDGNSPQLPISANTQKEQFISIGLFVGFYILFYFILTQFTDSDVPQWDSLTTSLFLVAMWLMAKKKIENWIAWIIGDIISVPLYAYKGWYLTSLQFVVFTMIAIAGYIEWRRRIQNKSLTKQ